MPIPKDPQRLRFFVLIAIAEPGLPQLHVETQRTGALSRPWPCPRNITETREDDLLARALLKRDDDRRSLPRHGPDVA